MGAQLFAKNWYTNLKSVLRFGSPFPTQMGRVETRVEMDVFYTAHREVQISVAHDVLASQTNSIADILLMHFS